MSEHLTAVLAIDLKDEYGETYHSKGDLVKVNVSDDGEHPWRVGYFYVHESAFMQPPSTHE